MSRPRYDWWAYVKGMIRRYPALREQYKAIHSTPMVADYSGLPRGGGGGRILESAAIRELPSTSQREYEAVRRAIKVTERYSNGRDRLAVINMVLWAQSHTIAGAALMVPCHEITARKWHSAFIRTVACFYGLLDT